MLSPYGGIMEELLSEVEKASQSGFAYVALFTALTLPDICGSMESENGRATGERYKAWFDEWVAPKYQTNNSLRPTLSGDTCYAYRCGLLHQGRNTHDRLGYSRILFLLPHSGVTMHNNVLNDALNLDIPIFVKDITSSVRQWLELKRGDPQLERNFAHFMKVHPHGFPPYIVGVPVVS